MDSARQDDLAAMAALADPVRRRIYDHVVGTAGPVGREAVAAATGIAVHTVRLHLDRLADEGLLAVDHRRLTGRSGPGAGRPAKVYRRAEREVVVSVPPRSYGIAGELLAAAVERSLSGEALAPALAEVAVTRGRAVGASYDGSRRGRGLALAEGVLEDEGYEPARDGSSVVLRNCPFDALARQHTELVCGLNRDYVDGLLDGAGCRGLDARLDPDRDRCCVRVTSSAPS